DTIINTVDALGTTGLAAVGYTYVLLDDCWQSSRDSDNIIQPDPKVFPRGIERVIDYIHYKGLKFGLYSDAGYKTCAGRPGSLGFETTDAKTYAQWQVDFLKYDNCYDDKTPPEKRYPVMRDALNATGRPIFFSMCEWGVDKPALWASTVGNSWRTTKDISDKWETILNAIDINDEFAEWAGPSGWNDPDILQVGRGGMTTTEYTSHFSLWAISKAPLIISADITNITNDTLRILSNLEVIAVNQDPLGVQGKKVAAYSSNHLSTKTNVRMRRCTKNGQTQRWIYRSWDNTVRSAVNGRCITVSDTDNALFVHSCQIGVERQQWHLNLEAKTLVSLGSETSFSVKFEIAQELFTIHNNHNDEKCLTVEQELEVWSGPLTDGSIAVLLLNRGPDNESITVKWIDIGIPEQYNATVRDLWQHADLGVFNQSYTAPVVDSHGVIMLRVTVKTT
ncbi:unnamed protein product, partial [Didymodactylos carnosus]